MKQQDGTWELDQNDLGMLEADLAKLEAVIKGINAKGLRTVYLDDCPAVVKEAVAKNP